MSTLLKFPSGAAEDDTEYDGGDGGGDNVIHVEITVVVEHRYPEKTEDSSPRVASWFWIVAAVAVGLLLFK